MIITSYQDEVREWAEKAESILKESPDGRPPAANQCKRGEHARHQEVDSKTLTQNVMALA